MTYNTPQTDAETDKLFENLKPILSFFENETYYHTGVSMHSGGFARADYDDHDEDYVYFTLKWGIQNDVEDRVNTEHYKISIDVVNDASIDPTEKYKLAEDA